MAIIDASCIYMVWLRDIIRYFREKSQLYGSIARPMLWLFVLGMGLRGSYQQTGDLSYTQFIFPGVISMTIIFTSIQSAISIIWDREFGFMKEILVAPVPRTSIALGKALAGTTLSLIQASIILLLSPLVKVHFALLHVLPILGVMMLLSFTLTGIGITIAARITSFQGFGTIVNFAIMPMWFLSGAIFPLTRLPNWLGLLVRANPLTYGVDLLRWLILGFSYNSPWLDLALLTIFGVAVTVISVLSFNRAEY